MPSYILRNIDPKLWAKVKARAEQDGHALRWVMLQLLTLYEKHGLKARPETDIEIKTWACLACTEAEGLMAGPHVVHGIKEKCPRTGKEWGR